MSLWYINAEGMPKSHRRPRICASCREHPKGGCSLPFRKAKRVRWLAAQEKKPYFFRGVRRNNFKRKMGMKP